MSTPRVNICMPVYGQVDPETMFSYTALVLKSQPLIRDLKYRCLLYIDQARNLLAADSLSDKEATHTLWLDSDMLWPSDLLERLLAHDKPVVGASYFRKVYPFDSAGGDFILETNGLKIQPFRRLRPGLHKVDCLGMGATLIKNGVFQDFSNSYSDNDWFRSDKCGEDVWFFKKLKDIGVPVYIDFDLVCGHQARDTISDSHWRSARGIPEPGAREVVTLDSNMNPELSDFADLYARMIKEVPNNGTVIEVGCFLGASLINLVRFASTSGKNIWVYGVDHFKGSADDVHQDLARRYGGDFYKVFEENLRKHGIEAIKPGMNDIEESKCTGKANVVQGDSADSATIFRDGWVDFCFIDAEHGYESVVRDIKAWLPKIKPGGVLAGHDYHWQSVKRAVTELLPDHTEDGNCWVWRKPK